MSLDPWIAEELIRLHNSEASIRIKAVTALRDQMHVSEVVHAMRMLIGDPDGHVRMLAAEALARQALYPRETLPVLIAVLEAADKADIAKRPHAKEWRRVAAGVIKHYGAEAEVAVPALRNALVDPDSNVRGYAAISLGAIGPAAIVALQDMRAARQTEPDEDVREQVYDLAIRQIVGSDNFTVIRQDNNTPPEAGKDRLRDVTDPQDGGLMPIIMGSRLEVDSGDINSILGPLTSLLKREDCLEYRQGIVFGITGYDDDPRELFEIPEVREWVRKLDEKWPYWFFFMRTSKPSTLALIAFCLCEYDVVPGGKRIRPVSLGKFMAEKFIQMNGVCTWLGDTEETITKMTNQISDYFATGGA